MKNKKFLIISLLILFFWGIIHTVTGQDFNSNALKHHAFSIESNIGSGILNQQRSDIIAGFGLWYYFRFKILPHEKRKSVLGIGIPLRYQMTTPNDEVFLKNEDSYSVAVLFRINTFFHPEKETFSIFWGVGPEVRTNIIANDDNDLIFMIQQEFGVRIYNPNGILKDNDIGLSVCSTLQNPYRESGLVFVNFFIRLKLF